MNESRPRALSETLDRIGFTARQKAVVGLCALIAMAEGFDTLAIGYLIPSMAKEWAIRLLPLIVIIYFVVSGTSPRHESLTAHVVATLAFSPRVATRRGHFRAHSSSSIPHRLNHATFLPHLETSRRLLHIPVPDLC